MGEVEQNNNLAPETASVKYFLVFLPVIAQTLGGTGLIKLIYDKVMLMATGSELLTKAEQRQRLLDQSIDRALVVIGALRKENQDLRTALASQSVPDGVLLTHAQAQQLTQLEDASLNKLAHFNKDVG